MSNKFQNEDFKSAVELIAAGGTKAQLLNTSKVYSQKSANDLETLLRKNNYAGTAAPTVTNDSSQGYEVGSVWFDTVNQKAYNCLSNTAGAAFWKEGGGGQASSNGLTATLSINNNQATFVDTGIAFTYPTIKSFEIFAQIIRTTATGSASEVTKLLGVYDIANSKWLLTDTGLGLSGVTFQITATGSIQYTSTNLAGSSYVGTLDYSYQANGGAITGTNPSSVSSDGLNYINGNAESGTTGWSTYADAAGTRPVDATGGTPTVALTTDSTSPLRGLKSYIFTKDAANRQGEGVSYPFTIDNASLAKVLSIDFDYLVNSGTFVPGTNTTDGDLIVTIYDVTNNVMIEPSSIKLLGNSTTIGNKFSATFQTAYNSLQYRLVFHVASTSALAYSLKLDNITVSPSKYIYGTPISDWKQYTPLVTNGGTLSGTANGFYRRVGDSVEVNVIFIATAAGSGSSAIQFSMPTGLLIDNSKVYNNNIIGGASVYNLSGTTLFNYTSVQATNVNQLRVIKPNSGSSAVGVDMTSNTQIEIKATVPVQGWSSSVQMSDSADTRVVALEATAATPTNLPGSNNSQTTPIYGSTLLNDTHGSYNISTGIYTIPVGGYYDFKVGIAFTGSYANNGTIDVHLWVNGVQRRLKRTINTSSTGNTIADLATGLIKLNAGDQVKPVVELSAWTSFSIMSSAAYNYFTLQRITGPSAIAASELIAARYTLTSGQTISNGGGNVTLNFNAKDYDTHGAYTSPNFIAPISGKYDVCGYAEFANSTGGGTIRLNIMKNGVAVSTSWVSAASSLAPWASQVVDTIQVNAGDQISITMSWNGTNGAALGSNSRLTVKRVGN